MDSPYFYVGENPICVHVDGTNFRQNRIRYLQFRDPLSQNHTTPMESQIATPVDFSQF